MGLSSHPDGGAHPPRAPKAGLLRRFRRSERGVAAVEFGLVAVPFFALMFAIFETALMFWANEILEESLSQASRRLLTGEAVSRYTSNNPAANAQAFRDDICALAPTGLIDCSKLYVDVKLYSSFANASAGTGAVTAGGALNTNGFTYNQPQPGQIIVARAVLDYQLFLTSWASAALANIGPGRTALIATTTFRAEPFVGS
ncbi:TadE/TadG family type IV pilus assembly protein [Bosea sp. TND4EK4]|uniref:TadE/TadG family type IV pilus assembly protein n=1 Tax=Bosea sp. TND4EK4 TaxID=1907408 RepID=UPI00095549D9|nr:TadE/TadG family type IV pilus assembly protein [Bosea sp. TND4EK4]SIQ96765.1 Flp pilus assembly protein TadG [Bosea sp. TND4EK4]